MRKLLLLLLTGLLTMIILVACGNDNEETMADKNDNTDTDVTGNADIEDTQEDSDVETSSESTSGFFEVTEDPQTDLGLGDAALIQTSIGTYELTIDSAEIVGTELDGEKGLLDEIILLEMRFKNIGDEPIIAEDVMINLGLVTDLEGSDNTNAAASFDSVEFFEGEIAPGEERTAQFIADTRTAEEYYFRTSPGAVAAGTHNEVIWTITDAEARK